MSWQTHNRLLVKEHVGVFKAANNYDIHDPETGEIVLMCREPNLGWFTRLLRFSSDYKTMTPFDIEIRDPDGTLIVQVRRGISLLRSTVDVLDRDGTLIGRLRQRLLSIGGRFDVQDPAGAPLFELKGKWTGWNFHFEMDGKELANVSKKWAGSAKELFTSADTYLLTIDPAVPAASPVRKLILAAVMSIDMVLKE